jgi:hypothetical protein
MFSLILLVFAFVLVCLAARNIGAPNWSLGWAGMACYFLSLIMGQYHR